MKHWVIALITLGTIMSRLRTGWPTTFRLPGNNNVETSGDSSDSRVDIDWEEVERVWNTSDSHVSTKEGSAVRSQNYSSDSSDSRVEIDWEEVERVRNTSDIDWEEVKRVPSRDSGSHMSTKEESAQLAPVRGPGSRVKSMTPANVTRREKYRRETENGTRVKNRTGRPNGRPITSNTELNQTRRAKDRERTEIRKYPTLTKYQEERMEDLSQTSFGKKKWPKLSKAVRVTKVMKSALVAISTLSREIGGRFKRGYTTYISTFFGSDNDQSEKRQLAELFNCTPEFMRKGIKDVEKKSSNWKNSVPLLTEKYAHGVHRVKATHEHELYRNFFLRQTSQQSGDRTETRHLNMSLHKLQECLYAEYPACLRDLARKYPSLLDETKKKKRNLLRDSFSPQKQKKLTRFESSLCMADEWGKAQGFNEETEISTRKLSARQIYSAHLAQCRLRWASGERTTSMETDLMLKEIEKITSGVSDIGGDDDDDDLPKSGSESCTPVGMKKFWRIIKEAGIKWTINVHPHECPLHDNGPLWKVELERTTLETNEALKDLNQVRQKLKKVNTEETSLRTEESRLAVLFTELLAKKRDLDSKVSRYQRHLEQYSVARDVVGGIEKSLLVGEALVYRDFVNLYTWEGHKMANLVLVVLWRDTPEGEIRVFKFNNLCTNKKSISTDCYFVADVFDWYFGKGNEHNCTFFRKFKTIFIAGDHGMHFSGVQTVFNESRMWRLYCKDIHVYSLCSYHAYSRADGAGVEVVRVGKLAAKERKGATTAHDYARVFNQSGYHNSAAIAFSSINRGFEVFEQCIEPKKEKKEEDDKLNLRDKCEIHYSYTDAKGIEWHEDGVVLCRDVPAAPTRSEDGKVQPGEGSLFEVYDVSLRSHTDKICRPCSKQVQAPVRHGEEFCPGSSFVAVSAVKANVLQDFLNRPPDTERLKGQQITKQFKNNMIRPVGKFPCRVEGCHGWHWFNEWWRANNHMLSTGGYTSTGHQLANDDPRLYPPQKGKASKNMKRKQSTGHQLADDDQRLYPPQKGKASKNMKMKQSNEDQDRNTQTKKKKEKHDDEGKAKRKSQKDASLRDPVNSKHDDEGKDSAKRMPQKETSLCGQVNSSATGGKRTKETYKRSHPKEAAKRDKPARPGQFICYWWETEESNEVEKPDKKDNTVNKRWLMIGKVNTFIAIHYPIPKIYYDDGCIFTCFRYLKRQRTKWVNGSRFRLVSLHMSRRRWNASRRELGTSRKT